MKEYLRSLAIAHYVVGGVRAFNASFGLIYCVMGIFMMMPDFFKGGHGTPPPPFIGGILVTVGGLFTLIGWTLAGLTIYSGRCMSRHVRRNFSIVIAALNCIFFPFGSALGVITLMMLTKAEAQALYEAAPPPPPAPQETLADQLRQDVPP